MFRQTFFDRHQVWWIRVNDNRRRKSNESQRYCGHQSGSRICRNHSVPGQRIRNWLRLIRVCRSPRLDSSSLQLRPLARVASQPQKPRHHPKRRFVLRQRFYLLSRILHARVLQLSHLLHREGHFHQRVLYSSGCRAGSVREAEFISVRWTCIVNVSRLKRTMFVRSCEQQLFAVELINY